MITITQSEYDELKALVSTLSKQVLVLQEEQRLLRNGRNSGTSSSPPSQDMGRSNMQNQRVKSGRKSGGQPGHEGHSLKIIEQADEVIDHLPWYCTDCGSDLEGCTARLTMSRQEIVIPPVQARCVEHRAYQKMCPDCGRLSAATLPPHLKAPIQYGTEVEAMVGYLSVYQHLPYNRIKALLSDLFGLSVSEGTIDSMLGRMSEKAMPLYDNIRERVAQSPVVGSDETGSRFAGKKGWFHVWQTRTLTFIVASMNRGFQTIESNFGSGFPASVYVSDCWAAQLKVPALSHQLCMAHLLRELRNFESALKCSWSSQMKVLLQQAIALKQLLSPVDYLTVAHRTTINQMQEKLTELLQVDHSASHQKIKAFATRLNKNRNSILTFLYHEKVPPDNNASERAIRNVKIKTKVSGRFATEVGAARFAIIRSVIDTTLKNTKMVFKALNLLAKTQPE